jgi:4-amino-4-deoxy-L-arabinose transferase-like glycosyltransferase
MNGKKIWDLLRQNLTLSLTIIFFLIGFIAYVSIDNTPPHWDAGRHFSNSFDYFEAFKHFIKNDKPNARTDGLVSLLREYNYYPPAVYLVSIPFLVLFGRTYQAALASNLVWILLLILSWIGLSQKLQFSKLARDVGMLFLLGSPFIIGQSREFQIDFPLLSIIMFCLWRLEAALQKQSLKNICLAAFGMGIGLMVKWSFALFIIVYLACYAVNLVLKLHKQKELKLQNLFGYMYIGIISVLAIAGNWYIPNLTRLGIDLNQNANLVGVAEGDPQGFTLNSALYYIRVFTTQYMWLGWMVVFSLVIGLYIYKKIKQTDRKLNLQNLTRWQTFTLFSVCNFVIMYAYLMNQGNKDVRYGIILIPSLVSFLSFFVQQLITLNLSLFWQKVVKYSAISVFAVYLLNLSLPLSLTSVDVFGSTQIPVKILGNSGYTNQRLKHRNWGIYPALEKARDEKAEFVLRNDICLSSDYWEAKPIVATDFDPIELHTNYGTVWGLSQQYGLQVGETSNSCFILVGRNQDVSTIDTKKYLQSYTQIGTYSSDSGFNLVLLKKKI